MTCSQTLLLADAHFFKETCICIVFSSTVTFSEVYLNIRFQIFLVGVCVSKKIKAPVALTHAAPAACDGV